MKATLKYLLCAAVLMASVASTVLSCTDTRSQLDRIHRQIEDPSLAALAAAVGHNDPLTGFTPVAENGAITAYKVTFKSAGDVTVYNGSHIASVTEDAARVVFTLSDGSQIIIPKLQALTIALQGDQATIKAGETVTVGYTIEGAEDATVTVLCGDGWSAAVKASGKQTGTIIVTAPTPVEQDKVIVFAGDGTGRLVAVEMRLTIDTSGDPDPPTPPDPPDPPVDPILVPVKTAYSVFKAGGQVEAGLIANVDYSVTTDAGWLHYLGTKAVRTDNLLFNVDANVGPARSATATISAGNYSTQITFHQEGISYYLHLSDDSFDIKIDGGTATLWVSSNTAYTYSCVSDWVSIEPAGTEDGEDGYIITASENKTYAARTATIVFSGQGIYDREVTVTQRGRVTLPVPHTCIPVCHIMPCCRTNNTGTRFLLGGKWNPAHDYQNLDDTRNVLQQIKDAGINVISIDFTNASQWDDIGQSALHNGDGGEFWSKFGPMLDNIVKVCAEKDMKYFLFLGNSLAPTTTLDYWNFIAGVVLERWASDPHYLRYGFGDDRPMLVMFLPGSRLASQLRSAPASQKNNLLQFHIGTCQVNSAITPTATDGWGYRNYSASSDGKVRFACPNGGVPPQDWYRVDAGEWKRRVTWALAAGEYAVLGSYDDTCDAIFWGIADVSRSTTGYHRNSDTEEDPYIYYNIVHDSLK